MWASLAIVLPVFGLIGLGYAARRLGLVSDATGEGLSDFVFTLSVPCLIFRTLARAELPAVQPWGYWIAYFAAVAIVWALASLAAGRFFHVGRTEAVVAGFAAGQANTVLVGIPLILKAYGEEGAVPLFLLVAIHLPVIMVAGTLLVEGRRAPLGGIAKRLLLHPVILALFAGLLGRLAAAALPEPLWQIIDFLANAAVPCSLVAMGIALHRYGMGAGWRLPALITALKLIVQPLIVLVLATQVFTMPRAWSGVAVLFAACPCGINAYLFAERYREGVAIVSGAVALSTALALFTTVLWLQVLGVG
ncbi:MAG: AEC family transporter [Microvirga sp.]|jgi:malonate transporter